MKKLPEGTISRIIMSGREIPVGEYEIETLASCPYSRGMDITTHIRTNYRTYEIRGIITDVKDVTNVLPEVSDD